MAHGASEEDVENELGGGQGIKRRGDWQTVKTFLPYLWPKSGPHAREMRTRVTASLIFLVLAEAAQVAVPYPFKLVVDYFAPETSVNQALVIASIPILMILAYGILRLLHQSFGELRDWIFAKVGQRAIRQVALKTFRHLHELSLRYHLERRTGGLSRVIERGTKAIDFILRFMLFNVIPNIIKIFIVCGVLWAIFGFWISLVTFVSVFGYIAWTFLVTEWRLQFRRSMNKADTSAHSKAVDSLLNYETVKYYGNETHESERFDSALKHYESAAVKSLTSLSLLNIGQGVIIAVGMILIMIIAAYKIQAGQLTVGDFAALNIWLLQLYTPLNFLGFVYREIKQSLVDMEQMFGLWDVEQEVKDKPGAKPLMVKGGELRFEDVTFAYEPRRVILKDVSFTVPPGRTVAIVGHSGAGKSTISRLLFRFYDVTKGRITIDGQDIRNVTQDSLRAAIGIVPQDTVLFNDTAYYNIAYGRPDASPEEVKRAAKMAKIHDFLKSLPDGYDTLVGERGLKLSGGEKQRVAIARTLLKDPAILMFDEATSALDTHTEKEIQKSIYEVSADRTTLIIAHRLSTVIHADEILVMDDGHILERGSHRQLLAKKGHYAEMWHRQQEAQEAEKALEKYQDSEHPASA